MPFDRLTHPHPPEQVVRLADADAGLRGAIVIHSTALGPAAGGCRLWRYPNDPAMLADAMRLAEGMTYKNALAGLPFGGGKAVICAPSGAFDRGALFRGFGRAVAGLHGRYVTAEDVGTSVDDMAAVAERTRHVAGLAKQAGAPGGDPSPWTALGVFEAMRVAVRRRLGAEIGDVTVAVQGIGHVGFALCELLHQAGARLIIAEPRSEVAARAATRFGAEIRTADALLAVRADVFAPCALGGVIDEAAVRLLRAKVVCGAANNQLATPDLAARLAEREILYAPDYLVNAGGIINVAGEYLGWGEADVRARVEGIGARLEDVLDHAGRQGVTPAEAAAERARQAIAAGRPAAAA